MKSPQQFSKELRARNLLLLEQPPVILGARLRKTTFADFLRLGSTQKLFACGDTAHLLRKLINDESMNSEVSAKQLRSFIRNNFGEDTRGIAYWQRVAKLLWLGYGAYLTMRVVADKAVESVLKRAKNNARRKLEERDRLMKRHRCEAAHKRWGQRA